MYASEILFDKSIFFYYNTLLLGEVDMQKTNTRKSFAYSKTITPQSYDFYSNTKTIVLLTGAQS